MNKRIVLGLVVVIAIACTMFFMRMPATAPVDVNAYVTMNISTLSPEPAVLGGTFYVTKIESHDGTGTVEYEDGHIALVADFTYRIDRLGTPIILSFVVRK